RKGKSSSSSSPSSSSSWDGLSPERRRLLRHHLHLRSSGWIQDPSGKWVKDGNAEFDSDEDEPPALPPT
ncbi:SCNM1 protein, partial [Smithornis capensis]|nr:SCNM1 protein [Smithornis capensis]